MLARFVDEVQELAARVFGRRRRRSRRDASRHAERGFAAPMPAVPRPEPITKLQPAGPRPPALVPRVASAPTHRDGQPGWWLPP